MSSLPVRQTRGGDNGDSRAVKAAEELIDKPPGPLREAIFRYNPVAP